MLQNLEDILMKRITIIKKLIFNDDVQKDRKKRVLAQLTSKLDELVQETALGKFSLITIKIIK